MPQIDSNTSVRETAKIMLNLHSDFVLVVENNFPMGIITYKDFVKKIITGNDSIDSTAKQIMSSPLIHSLPDQTIWEIADLMYSRGIKIIPIIDDYDKLLGTVSISDLLKIFSLQKIKG